MDKAVVALFADILSSGKLQHIRSTVCKTCNIKQRENGKRTVKQKQTRCQVEENRMSEEKMEEDMFEGCAIQMD